MVSATLLYILMLTFVFIIMISISFEWVRVRKGSQEGPPRFFL